MQPPTIARWLLNHFGCSPNNESVIGDLDERYSQGRSYLWYWRQALFAIVTSFFNEVGTHKLVTLRAIATGWVVAVVSRRAFNLTWEILSALASWSRLWRHGWITIAVQIPEVVLSGVLAGWLWLGCIVKVRRPWCLHMQHILQAHNLCGFSL